jgi:hypothetical protein
MSSPLCREPAPVALAVDPLCREPCSVPRACYVTSRQRWSAPWVLSVPRASSRTLGKGAQCREPVRWLSTQNFAHGIGCGSGSVRALPTQTLHMESISRRLYHKKLYWPMQIFYHGVYLVFLSDLLLPLY